MNFQDKKHILYIGLYNSKNVLSIYISHSLKLLWPCFCLETAQNLHQTPHAFDLDIFSKHQTDTLFSGTYGTRKVPDSRRDVKNLT